MMHDFYVSNYYDKFLQILFYFAWTYYSADESLHPLFNYTNRMSVLC